MVRKGEKKGTASRKYKVGAPTPFCRAYRLKRWKREKDDNKDYYYCILCPVPHRICNTRKEKINRKSEKTCRK